MILGLRGLILVRYAFRHFVHDIKYRYTAKTVSGEITTSVARGHQTNGDRTYFRGEKREGRLEETRNCVVDILTEA
jgi:hypothetical protein